MRTYYDEVNVDIDLNIEFNDGCATPFKCIRAIKRLTSRNMQCIRAYFEISHDKSKSDGLGGAVKGYVPSKNVLKRMQKNCMNLERKTRGEEFRRG